MAEKKKKTSSSQKTTKSSSATNKSNNAKKDESGAIDRTIQDIKTKFGDEAIMKLGERPHVDVDAVSSGSVGVDWALGVGGFPRGRVVELFGPESSGKSTLALHTVAEAQKNGGVAAFIDAEHALDPEYAQKLGVNIDDLLISQPSTGEQGLEIVDSLVRSGKLDVIVVDSVAALTPQEEIEGDMGKLHVGKQARLMAQALRKLTAITARSKTVVIFINQIRMNIGQTFGNPETTPGGKSLKFYSSVRLDVRRIAQIKKGDTVMGGRHRAKVVKNKVAAPFKMSEFDLLYNEGVSQSGELLALGEKLGVITKAGGGSYGYGTHKLGRGYDAARTYLSENPQVANEILKEIRAKLAEQ